MLQTLVRSFKGRLSSGGLGAGFINSSIGIHSILSRKIHQSSVLLMGKKKGASAFDPAPRALSRKQLKRKNLKIKAKTESKDRTVKKISAQQMEESMKSPELQKYMDESAGSLEETIKVFARYYLLEGREAFGS